MPLRKENTAVFMDMEGAASPQRRVRLGYLPPPTQQQPDEALHLEVTPQPTPAPAEDAAQHQQSDPAALSSPSAEGGGGGAQRPPSPDLIRALRLIGEQNPSVFASAAEVSYADYVSGVGGTAVNSAPVFGIPVVCAAPHQSTSATDPNGPAARVLVHPMTFRQPPQVDREDDAAATAEGQHVWSLSRSTRIFAVADLFIVVILIFSRYWMAALSPFPIIGYMGARKYRLWMVSVYLAYFPFIIGARGYFAYSNAQESSLGKSSLIVLVLLSVVGGLAELYIAFVVFRLRRALKTLSAGALELLQSGWHPAGVTTNFF